MERKKLPKRQNFPENLSDQRENQKENPTTNNKTKRG